MILVECLLWLHRLFYVITSHFLNGYKCWLASLPSKLFEVMCSSEKMLTFKGQIPLFSKYWESFQWWPLCCKLSWSVKVTHKEEESYFSGKYQILFSEHSSLSNLVAEFCCLWSGIKSVCIPFTLQNRYKTSDVWYALLSITKSAGFSTAVYLWAPKCFNQTVSKFLIVRPFSELRHSTRSSMLSSWGDVHFLGYTNRGRI